MRSQGANLTVLGTLLQWLTISWMTTFFRFGPKTGHVAYCGTLEIPKPWSWLDLHRGNVRPRDPLVMRYNVGGPLRDVVITGYARPVVVSDRFVVALREAGCSGWTLFPVTVYDKHGIVAEGYHGLQVTGVSGPIDWRRSQPVPKHFTGGVFPMLKGFYFGEETWDGSDVFGPRDSGFTFLTDKAASALKRSRITNMDLEPIEEVITNIWPGDGQPGWKHLWRKRWEELSPADLKPSS